MKSVVVPKGSSDRVALIAPQPDPRNYLEAKVRKATVEPPDRAPLNSLVIRKRGTKREVL